VNRPLRTPALIALPIAVVVMAGVVACTRSEPRPIAQAGAAKPNIVFVLADDLSRNLVPFMPNVRRMQARGVRFSNYFVTDSLCCPSRSSIFTGRFPHNTGVFKNAGPDGGFNAFRDKGQEDDTFATSLKAAGYRTGMMGKYLNGYLPKPDGNVNGYVPPGWDEWDVAGNGYGGFDYALNENGQVHRYGRDQADYLTDVIANKAVSFISNAADAKQPFVLEVATFAPHAPYTPAPRDAAKFPDTRAPRDRAFNHDNAGMSSWLAGLEPLTAQDISTIDQGYRKRAQSVQAIDAMLGRINQTLTDAGVAGNTYVIFSSDNGYHMGEHRLTPGKMTAFDTDVRVPLIVTGPGVPGSRVIEQVAENIDVRPTFEDLAGVPVSSSVDGHSLAALISGDSVVDWRSAALVEHRGPVRDPADPDAPGAESPNPPSYNAIRTADTLYVEYVTGERELFDLRSDPDQLVNVADDVDPLTVAQLHTALVAATECQGADACWAAQHTAQ
jgi:arylsulfatase A-like enzyme